MKFCIERASLTDFFVRPLAWVRGVTMARNSAIDRAFELARSGHYRSVSEIIRRVPVDDRAVVEAHLAQPAARRELILICSDAWLSAN
jgi:hypothetical protein